MQGSLRKLLNGGDGISVGLETQDGSPHYYCLRVPVVAIPFASPKSLQHHKRKHIGLSKSTGVKVYALKGSATPPPPPSFETWNSTIKTSRDFHTVPGNASDDEVGVEEILEDSDFQADELSSFRGLVLDLSYRPVNVVCWKRAICLEFMEKADVLEYYDQTVNSPSGSFYIPAVLRVPHLLQVVKRRRIKSNLSRKNIFYRDSFTCQYCSSRDNLTVDHVLPIARGGEWTWENLVTACAKCNSRKGQKTLDEANMKLIKVPKVPKDYDILAIPLTTTAINMLSMKKATPEEWRQYLAKSN